MSQVVILDGEAFPTRRYWNPDFCTDQRRKPNPGPSPCGEIQLTAPQLCTLSGPPEKKIAVNVLLNDRPVVTFFKQDVYEKIATYHHRMLSEMKQRMKARQFRLNKMRWRTR